MSNHAHIDIMLTFYFDGFLGRAFVQANPGRSAHRRNESQGRLEFPSEKWRDEQEKLRTIFAPKTPLN